MQFLHAVRVVLRGDVAVDAAAIVDIVNFADAEDRNFPLDEHVHQHRARRLDRVIVAALGAPKISRRARERPGNHAAHFVRPVEHFPGNFAHAVQLGDGDHVFVRRDLEYAVARGVNDREARSNVFLAQFLDDFGSGGGLVADRLAADGAFELFDQFARKTVLVNGKCLRQPDSGHLPVPCGRVLARRMRGAFAVAALRTRRRRQVIERGDIRKSEAHKVRQRQRARFSDVAERVAAHVVVIRGVGQRADPHAVQHNPDDSFERRHRLPRRKVYSLASMRETNGGTLKKRRRFEKKSARPVTRPCADLDCDYAAFSSTIRAVAVLEMAT